MGIRQHIQIAIFQERKFFMGNLHSDATEEDLRKLFGLRLTQYLKQNCLCNMSLINKTGKSNGFAFIFTPGKVHHDLLELDRMAR